MADATITTYQRNLSNVSTTSAATFAAIAPTSTKPTAGVVVDHRTATGNGAPSMIRAIPYAALTTGTSIRMRFVGWAIEVDNATGTEFYVPFVLGDFNLSFTSGTIPTWTLDGATQRPFATITQVAGTPSANPYSPGTANSANVEPAAVLLDLAGCQLVSVQFQSATAQPTMGVLYATL